MDSLQSLDSCLCHGRSLPRYGVLSSSNDEIIELDLAVLRILLLVTALITLDDYGFGSFGAIAGISDGLVEKRWHELEKGTYIRPQSGF